ncbi:methyl-directed repair DNA adenine methylase [Geminocystis sp. NIES-3708]|uniref:DNA adenine methylase n=1 Tax=Geminocystis sp. NIES-3708 TaxID=1615909 RepID=UPI0005FCDB1F|nr:DNA adenine methylase [Geminocystis sp. NIES-3708]BAQ61863.1 methyl-directed repair DNA adenine methylase [Geminocystis sp. NIES-3708]
MKKTTPVINKAKPFLKWAGGKNQLLNTIRNFYPESLKKNQCSCYIEPFIGGGAVFFDIVQNYQLKYSYLSDINPEIVITYKVIQKSVDLLIEKIAELSEQYQSLNLEKQKEFFYQIREIYNQDRKDFNYTDFSDGWIKRSAMLIFMNKTCFNGLFRTNKSGEFNVPHGEYKNPTILDQENLINVSTLLQNSDIELADFSQSINAIKDNSFMYLDPPYRPLNKTSNFTSYSTSVFNDFEQQRLAEFYKKLNCNYKIYLMLSNSDPKNENPLDNFFDELYQQFNIHRVSATRMINSKGSQRGNINELLITNY